MLMHRGLSVGVTDKPLRPSFRWLCTEKEMSFHDEFHVFFDFKTDLPLSPKRGG